MAIKNSFLKLVLSVLAFSLVFGGVVSLAQPAPAEAAARCVNYQYSQGGYASCVGEIQRLLNSQKAMLYTRAWDKVAVDNSYGPGTKAAVKSFQMTVGIKADGVVGINTWKQLCKIRDLQLAPPPAV